jgi:hypothetical protein
MDAEPIIEFNSDQRRMKMMESFIELAESIQKISKNLTICKRLGLVINWQTLLANTIDGLSQDQRAAKKTEIS